MSIQQEFPAQAGSGRPRDEWSAIVAWRQRLLREAGFPTPLAARMAASRGVDIHELLNLVDKGCPPELAVRIAGPVGDMGSYGDPDSWR
ncbi:hypothetical protein BIU82_05610 [Arthrobacter sp. SW1]|uniref:hypothetical protein n=1 Tax=Arthrobacter sp. SW1 TaxID=1920889 RepID=UPI000877C9C5|nr:hypothetical protein [Arthrobacter sp. SW1]OFI37981.1 hypothetical protein BIU82_05610 [Arthrobacter sp. SW1]